MRRVKYITNTLHDSFEKGNINVLRNYYFKFNENVRAGFFKYIFIISSLFIINSSFAQENNSNIEKQKLIESYQTEISSIKNEIKNLNERINRLKSEDTEVNSEEIKNLNLLKIMKEDELNELKYKTTILLEK